jgi:hypothetical protein
MIQIQVACNSQTLPILRKQHITPLSCKGKCRVGDVIQYKEEIKTKGDYLIGFLLSRFALLTCRELTTIQKLSRYIAF